MRIAVLANTRTTQAATQSRSAAMRVAFNGGAVTGLLVIGLALLSVGIFYTLAKHWMGHDLAVKSLVGLALGSSLISVFARLGGGIYTKAADVGADLVGKIESNLEEDDPRNPATIADNVGDNVGDCAGMAADVFETYAVSLVGAILLGALTLAAYPAAIIYPFVLGGISVLGAIIGILFVNISGGKPATVLMGSVGASALVSAILFWPATHMLFPGDVMINGVARSANDLYFASLVGLLMTGIVVVITNYYTSTSLRAGPKNRQGFRNRPRHEYHCRPRHRPARHRAARRVYRPRHPAQLPFRRPLRHRHRGHEHALHGGNHHFARCLRSDHGQRRRHRRHEQSAEGSPRDHRRARRGRQHHESRDEGLRHRFGRVGGAGPLRFLRRGIKGAFHAAGRAYSFDFSLNDPKVIIGLFIGGLLPIYFHRV